MLVQSCSPERACARSGSNFWRCCFCSLSFAVIPKHAEMSKVILQIILTLNNCIDNKMPMTIAVAKGNTKAICQIDECY